MKRLLPPILALVLLTSLLEIGASLELINPVLVPPPTGVALALWELFPDFAQAFAETGACVALGFLGAALTGVAAALILSSFQWLRKAVLPFAIFFQTVPIIAIAPLLVIYFGFGSGTVVASALIVSVFPVLANMLIGLQSVDPGELELFRLYGASPWKTLIRLRIPRAYPSLYAGLKVAAGLSVIGAVAGEFVAGGGLGAMIDSARTQQRIDLVFAALFLLSLLGLALIALLRLIHGGIQRWRPYGQFLKD